VLNDALMIFLALNNALMSFFGVKLCFNEIFFFFCFNDTPTR
jgi:hypothetical protein